MSLFLAELNSLKELSTFHYGRASLGELIRLCCWTHHGWDAEEIFKRKCEVESRRLEFGVEGRDLG